jgi:predicted transcriptional regulator
VRRTVIRLPSEVVEHLDRLADELRAAHPKRSFSRASLMRALVSAGLAFVKAKDARLIDVARLAARDAPREGARRAR